MNFATLVHGTRSHERVSLFFWGDDAACCMRPLSVGEMSAVYADAAKQALARGAREAVDGDRVYDLELMMHTVVRATLTTDGKPFFADVEAMRASPHVLDDHIVYLYERWQGIQDAAGGRVATMTENEFLKAIGTVAGMEEGQAAFFFYKLRPGMRVSLLHFSARLLATLLQPKSDSGSASIGSGDT